MGKTTTVTRDGSGQTLRITSATWLDEANATTNNDASKDMRMTEQGSGNNKIGIMRIEIPTRQELGIPDKAILKNITLDGEKVTGTTISLDVFRMKDQYTNFLASTATFESTGRNAWAPKYSSAEIFDVPAGTWYLAAGASKQFSLQPIISASRNKDWFGTELGLVIYDLNKTSGYSTLYSDYHESQLAEALDTSEGEIDVDDGSVYTADHTILIDSEEITVGTISTNTLGTGGDPCTRGANSTTPAEHLDNTIIYNLNRVPTFSITYELPSPEPFAISMSGDGTTANLDVDKQAIDDNQQKINIGWHTTLGSVAYDSNAQDFEDYGRQSYSSTDMSGSPLADEDETYHFALFSEDSLNTDADATISNKAAATRPKMGTPTIDTAFTNTGDKGKITIPADVSGDWNTNGAKKLSGYYIDWDVTTTHSGTAQAGASGTITLVAGASAVNDTYNDMWIITTGGTGSGQSRKITDYVGSSKVANVSPNWAVTPSSDTTYQISEVPALDNMSKIELRDKAVTSVSREHVYTTAGTKNIYASLIDTKGFRSDTVLLPLVVSVSATTPTAVPLVSKKTYSSLTYGLLDSVNTLNGIKSVAGTSDTEIYHYHWQHADVTGITTAFPTDNDNSAFLDESDTVKCLANWGSNSSASKAMNDAVLTVYGLASFYDSGSGETATADTHSNFTSYGYYRMAKSTISPAATHSTLGSASNNYFKRIDCIAVTTKASNDHVDYPAYFTVKSTADDDLINNKISCIGVTTFWGGYATSGAISTCTVEKDAGYIDKTDIEFLEKGFRINQKVYVTFATSTTIDGIYTISALTNDRMTFSEGLTGSGSATETVNVYADTRGMSAIPFVSSASASHAHRFTLAVSQSRDASNLQSDTAAVHLKTINELDLNAKIDAGDIAITSSTVSRSGGLSGKMSLGTRTYPLGTNRTNMGLPEINLNVVCLTQAGLRDMWALIEGNRFDWVLLESDRIDSPATPHRTFVMKLSGGTLNKAAGDGKHYVATLKFVAIGEEL